MTTTRDILRDAVEVALPDLADDTLDEVTDTIIRRLAAREYLVTYDFAGVEARRRIERERRVEREAAERLAAAVPYSGAIKACQTSVANAGRSVGSHRCTRKGQFVVRSGWDGPMVVCRLHATKPSGRYRADSSWRHSADEPIEEEFVAKLS